MKELIELAEKDLAAEKLAFERALGAFRARKKLRKNFPTVIRNLKNGIKALNRAGLSCKPLQRELAEVHIDLVKNEEILAMLGNQLQPGWEQLQKRKEVLSLLNKMA